MPLQSKEQYESIIVNGEDYRKFVPAGKEAQYKQYFKKYWEFDEKRSGVTDQGQILGGWATFKKNLSEKIGKKSCIAVSYCHMFLLSLGMYTYVFHPCYTATQPLTPNPIAYQPPPTQPLTIQQPPSPQPHTTSPLNPSPPSPLPTSPLPTRPLPTKPSTSLFYTVVSYPDQHLFALYAVGFFHQCKQSRVRNAQAEEWQEAGNTRNRNNCQDLVRQDEGEWEVPQD